MSVDGTVWDVLHKKLEFSIGLFLDDILNSPPLQPIGNYFDIKEIGNMVRIIPLFYCSEIRTDGDGVVINSPYMIMVPNDYKSIIIFIGKDNQDIDDGDIGFDSIIDSDYVTVYSLSRKTGETIPNVKYRVVYENYPNEIKTTGYHGYGGFIKKESFRLEVV